MEQRRAKPLRIVIYMVLGPLFILSVAANLYLFQRATPYVTHQPVDPGLLYSAVQVGAAQGYLELEPAPRVTHLEQQLASELAFSALGSSREKIEALGSYLLSLTEAQEGMPSPPINAMNGLDTFEEMLQGRVNVWPNLIARIYVMLANASGIPSRLVRLVNPISRESRWFAESYVIEQKKWTVVDLLYRKLFVEDGMGEAVSSAELLLAVEQGQIDQFAVALFEGGGISYRPLAEHAASERYYFTRGSSLEFPAPGHLEPTILGSLRAYLYAPSQVVAVDWSPFLRWNWVKLVLLSCTALFGLALTGLLISDLRA